MFEQAPASSFRHKVGEGPPDPRMLFDTDPLMGTCGAPVNAPSDQSTLMVSNSARKKAAREHQLLHGGTYASALAAVKQIEVSVPSLSSWTLSRMIDDGAARRRHRSISRALRCRGPSCRHRRTDRQRAQCPVERLARGIREDARVGIVARGGWKGLDELVPRLGNAVVAQAPSGLAQSLDWEFSLSRHQLESTGRGRDHRAW